MIINFNQSSRGSNPAISYYTFRGIGAVNPQVCATGTSLVGGHCVKTTNDPIYCVNNTTDCYSCEACCVAQFPGNLNHQGRCKNRCQLKYPVCGTGTGACTNDSDCNGGKCINGVCQQVGSATHCGIACEGGQPTGTVCSYSCDAPWPNIPPTSNLVVTSNNTAVPLTSAGTILGYDANGNPVYASSGVGTGGSLLDAITGSPLLLMAGVGLILWKVMS